MTATLTDEDQIRQLIGCRIAAMQAKNADALVAPYAPGAVIYDLAPPLRQASIDAAAKRDLMDGSFQAAIDLEP